MFLLCLFITGAQLAACSLVSLISPRSRVTCPATLLTPLNKVCFLCHVSPHKTLPIVILDTGHGHHYIRLQWSSSWPDTRQWQWRGGSQK